MAKGLLVFVVSVAVLLVDVNAACLQGVNGVSLSGFTVSKDGVPVSAISKTGGTYTLSGTLTISSGFAAYQTIDMEVKTVIELKFPIFSSLNYDYPCDSCVFKGYTCSQVASQLGVSSSLLCTPENHLKTGSFEFSVTQNIPNMSQDLPVGLEWAKAKVTTTFRPSGSSDVIGCILEQLDINV